jgi:hypothetical protein
MFFDFIEIISQTIISQTKSKISVPNLPGIENIITCSKKIENLINIKKGMPSKKTGSLK